MNHIEFGSFGENLAREYLEQKGYKILEQNWRFGRLEVDLIAISDSFLIIIEVKSRSSSDFGSPDEAVGHRKIDFLAEAAAAYQEVKDLDLETRFDIISVVMKGNSAEIIHIEEAFHP